MASSVDGIETGYEEKFDFPLVNAPPRIAYLLASVPRAGSTYFSHVLWRTGCLGAPLEYLNFEPLGPHGFAAESPELQQQIWRAVLRRRTSPNGVFGLKGFQMQLQDLHRSNPPLLDAVLSTLLPRGRPKWIVYLRRRDRVAQSVSYARATMTGIWRKEQEGSGPPTIEYSQDMLESAERGIAVQEARWEHMFRDLRVEPLRMWHEDVLADPAGAAREVGDFLGVPIDPAAAVQIPEIRKQTEGDAPAWRELYARSREAPPPRA